MDLSGKVLPECPVHTGKLPKLVCLACDKVICSSCKKSGHHGHPVIDIQQYAHDYRVSAAQKKSELEKKTSEVIAWRRKHLHLRKEFDFSVKHAKEDIRARGQELIHWVNKHVEKKIANVNRFAAENGRKHLTRNIQDAGKRLKALEEHRVELTQILGQDLSDVQVALLATTSSDEESRRASAVYTFLPEVPGYMSHVYLPDVDTVNWRKGLRDFLGQPRLAQTDNKLSRKNKLAVAHSVTCSTDPGAEILGLHVLQDGRLCVAVLCREPHPNNDCSIHLKILDVTGKSVLHDSILPFATKKVKFAQTTSGQQLIVASAYSLEMKIVDLPPSVTDPSSSHASPCKLYAFKRDSSEETGILQRIRKKSQARREYFKVYEVGLEDQRAAFAVHADDPQTLAYDASGQNFAVIQIERVMDSVDSHFSEMPSVVVFERPREHEHHHHHHTGSSGHLKDVEPKFQAIRTDRKNFFPSDVCFYKYKLGREVLVVADLANNALYKVDHESVGPVLQLLMTGCPLLDSPTALTTDNKGRLLVGCKGGCVVTLVAREDVCERDYELPIKAVHEDSSEYERGNDTESDDELYEDEGSFFHQDVHDVDRDSSSVSSEEEAVQMQRVSGESGYAGSDVAHRQDRSSGSSAGSGSQHFAERGAQPGPSRVSVSSSVSSYTSDSRSISVSSIADTASPGRKDSSVSQSSVDLPTNTSDVFKGAGRESPVVVSSAHRHPQTTPPPAIPLEVERVGDDECPTQTLENPPLPPKTHHLTSEAGPKRSVDRPPTLPPPPKEETPGCGGHNDPPLPPPPQPETGGTVECGDDDAAPELTPPPMTEEAVPAPGSVHAPRLPPAPHQRTTGTEQSAAQPLPPSRHRKEHKTQTGGASLPPRTERAADDDEEGKPALPPPLGRDERLQAHVGPATSGPPSIPPHSPKPAPGSGSELDSRKQALAPPPLRCHPADAARSNSSFAHVSAYVFPGPGIPDKEDCRAAKPTVGAKPIPTKEEGLSVSSQLLHSATAYPSSTSSSLHPHQQQEKDDKDPVPPKTAPKPSKKGVAGRLQMFENH